MTLAPAPAPALAENKVLLHVGCGRKRLAQLPDHFASGWSEIRYDIDPGCKPDIIGDITDLSAVADGSVDAIWSAHNIEHLFAHEAPIAVGEFRRVLTRAGFLIITCPDLARVVKAAAAKGLDAVLYTSAMGPITPRDVMFGHQASIRAGGHYMAHRNGYDLQGLNQLLQDAGFAKVYGERRGYELCFMASRRSMTTETIRNSLAGIRGEPPKEV